MCLHMQDQSDQVPGRGVVSTAIAEGYILPHLAAPKRINDLMRRWYKHAVDQVFTVVSTRASDRISG